MLKKVLFGNSHAQKIFNITKRCSAAIPRLGSSPGLELEQVDENNVSKEQALCNLRHKYPEFLPDPTLEYRNPLREKLERQDMVKRRKNVNIPEFYVGSVLAVTSSDVHCPGKTVKFLGICIYRGGHGLYAEFILRNVVDHQGMEIRYLLYSPTIQKIEVIRLEKRLDDDLFYLRDAPEEYSTFPFDMEPQYIDSDAEVPINTLKIKLNPRPWLLRYERLNYHGVILPPLPKKIMDQAKAHLRPWEKYDLMAEYRKTIPEEEQNEVFSDISGTLKELESKQKAEKKKSHNDTKTSTQTKKQTLF